jgi:integrase
VLNYLRSLDLTPQLSSDSIRDALKYMKVRRGLPKFLPKHEIAQLLEAAIAHDARHFKATREENAGLRPVGSTPRHTPVAPLVISALLTGCRISELLNLRWEQVQLEEKRLTLDAADTKTGRGRFVDLSITLSLRWMLSAMKRVAKGPFVFLGSAPYRKDLADSAKKRLLAEFGVAKFTWHDLRRTCGTFLVCAPNIYGAASVFMAAKRLGHSVEVSERHYLGLLTTISPKARRLERAMEVEDLCVRIAKGVGIRTKPGTAQRRPQLRLLRRA